jgi:negative regulator of sigma E activity
MTTMTSPDHNPLVDEQLSAWLDDELPQEELNLLRARLESSPECRARLARYSLIGNQLRDSQPGRVQSGVLALGLSARVSAALHRPPVSPAEASLGEAPAWPGRVLPYALAAGLALAAVGLTNLLRQAQVGPGLSAGDQAKSSVRLVSKIERQARPPDTVGRRSSLSPQRLTSYLVYHGEYSGPLSARVTESHIVNQSRYVGALQAVDRSPGQ